MRFSSSPAVPLNLPRLANMNSSFEKKDKNDRETASATKMLLVFLIFNFQQIWCSIYLALSTCSKGFMTTVKIAVSCRRSKLNNNTYNNDNNSIECNSCRRVEQLPVLRSFLDKNGVETSRYSVENP